MTCHTATAAAALVVAALAALPAGAQDALPEAIRAPGETVVMTLHGVGAQIYDCKSGADGKLLWEFREPVATLLRDGKTVGQHYAGPSWELQDGSVLVGKVAARAPGKSAGDIPWLKLEIASRRGSGQLTPITTIQRINTSGGVASGACDKAGALLSVPYATDYLLLRR